MGPLGAIIFRNFAINFGLELDKNFPKGNSRDGEWKMHEKM